MKKSFLTGLAILLPLAVTASVLSFFINLLTQPFVGLVSRFLADHEIATQGFLFLTPKQTLTYGSQILILILLFIFTICLGILTRYFIGKSLLHLGDRIMHKIPLVKTVYKMTQDIIRTLFSGQKSAFKEVVMIPFPTPGSYVLGFATQEAPATCSDKVGKELISVLIPTTPNPTSGFLLMFPKEDLIYVDMKPEEAIKFIISCGVIVPKIHLDDKR